MKPTLLTPAEVDGYLAAGHWTRDTQAGRFADHAREIPDAVACTDGSETLSWAELDALTDNIAANLIALGIERDSRAIVRMASGCREMALRIAFKKAGILGVFAPLQWRRRELDYVRRQTEPALAVVTSDGLDDADRQWIERTFAGRRIDPGGPSWDDLAGRPADAAARDEIPARAFAFDEVSLITASSGTSGLAKLCEWPEAAQLCVGRAIGERLRITPDDTVGIYSPMSGAAGVLVWLVSAATPARFVFPASYRPKDLLELVAREQITVATTVPVILARLAQEPLGDFDLAPLRALRVGTAAADTGAGRAFEAGADCRVIPAAGSMECPGFAHADFDEDTETRLSGAVGLPLPGCRSRIVGDGGANLAPGETGELWVTAPYAASGYWNDPAATEAAWHDGWYATGDIGTLSEDGRLRLMGRLKETINRSGLKILPADVEHEIARHPDVFACAVVGAPDPEYGEVPWAFVQPRPGHAVDTGALAEMLRQRGLAHYKIPVRFIAVEDLPRVAGNKVDKKALLAGLSFD